MTIKTILGVHYWINTNFHEGRGRSTLPGGAEDGSGAASSLSSAPSVREHRDDSDERRAGEEPCSPIQTPPTGPVWNTLPACNSPSVCPRATDFNTRPGGHLKTTDPSPPIPPFSSHIPLRNLARDSSKKSIVSPNAPSANLCLLAGAVADAPIQPSGALHEEYLVHSLFFLYPVWKSPSLSLGAHHRPLFVPAQWLMRTRNATSRFCVDSGH